MTIQGLLYIALVFVLVLGCAFPMGRYMAAIFEGRVKFLAPLETGFYKLCGIDPNRAMRWQDYTVALLLLSVIHFFLLYAILRLQYYLPMNPQHITGMPPTPGLQHRRQLHHQHQLAGLRAGEPDLQRRAGVRPGRAYVRLRRGGHRGRGRGHARLHRRRAEIDRQFLCRPNPHHPVPAAAGQHRGRHAVRGRRHAADLRPLPHRAHAERRIADHRHRPGRVPGSDQGIRHQRRRLLQRQLGPSVREPERLDQSV